MKIKGKSVLAGILSLIVPGLGQIYRGKTDRGVKILAVSIIIGILNFVLMSFMCNSPAACNQMKCTYLFTIPMFVHFIIAGWSLAFWIWAIVDAYTISNKKK